MGIIHRFDDRMRRFVRAASIATATLALSACDDNNVLDSSTLRTAQLKTVTIGIFADMCIDKLPAMEGIRESLATVAKENLQVTPTLDRENFSAATHLVSGVQLIQGTPGWPAFGGEYRCEASAPALKVIETSADMLAVFNERAGPGIALTDSVPDGPGEQRAWDVSGARSNMRLEVATGPSAAGGNRLTIMRLVWRD